MCIRDRPALVLGFSGASAQTLQAIMDPQVGLEHHIAFDQLDWVEDHVDSGARNVDHILNGTLLPEIAESVLAKMAEGAAIAKIKVGANKDGKFKYTIR